MTEQDKLYFEKLAQDRKESAAMLDKPSMRGVKKSVVEKYSDQAHFIYELIQNADDAGATEAHFELYKKELIFRHNGTRHFFVSNPETEEQDTKRGCLGDINAITSIANSNKTDTAATIGKFGVGFKAVFQYTMTPHIYDSNAAFKIEHFIVPVLLEKDYKSRKEEETIFVFPFDHPENDAEKAYQDIQEKLQNLVFPILFLKNLHLITYWTISKSGKYTKEFLQNEVFDNTTEADLIKVKNGIGEEANRLWVFSRTIAHNLKYSVGFFLDKKGELTPVDYSAFCFFPTKTATGLKFIIDAPFLLTDSREGIKAAEPHNIKMVEMLAELAADSLSYLKDLGEKNGIRLLNDNISGIIPTNPNIFSSENNRDTISFLPIYNKIRDKMKSGLLPTRADYTKGDFAYWSDTLEINSLFSDAQLTNLLGKALDYRYHFRVFLDYYIECEESGKTQNTVPHDYPVKLLTTQYRSIPEIGEIFSKLTYDGILEHYRQKAERRELHIEEYLKYDSLNIIKFPVSKYESIYRAKRLKTSSNYQAYSALFVFEFVQFLAEKLAQKNPDEKFRIGIIAPYNAQAGLIERLLDDAKKMGIFSHLIEIGCSTIHGFQGDECDIIITVFNPPPYISDNPEMFLNHQNIINVAISRARDYLFVLMPDDKTDRVNRLFLIKSLEHLIKRSGAYVETDSHTLEQAMMGTPNFLEDNSFSTGHQLVNVYGQPEKRYEIRSEDSAVDIQVHRENIALAKPETETIKPVKNESPSENKEEPAKINTNEIHPNKGQNMIPPSGGFQRIKPGAYVRHRLFGVGRIESIEGRRIVVSFPGGKKVFEFPTAFKMGFLKLC